MSKISTLSSQEVASALASAEAHMSRPDAKPSLAAILRSMASLGLCSPRSAGAEKTLVRRALELGVPLPTNVEFAAAKVVAEFRQRPAPAKILVSMRAVSRVEVSDNNEATAVFPDGKRLSIGAFDERALRSSCDLIELRR